MKKVIVVGAGVAGLCSAIRLQHKGFDVTILEKENIPGGRMHLIEEDGFKFDVGPTIVMMPEIYREIFTSVGKDPDDYIKMELLEPMYSIHFNDGSHFDISTDLTKLMSQLESISREEALGYLKYLADVYQRYLVARKDFIEKSFRHPRDFYNFKSLKSAYKLKTLNSAYSSISKFVKDDRLRKALSFQTLYIGISPYTGPSIYTIIPMIELLYGVWYIKGGMYAMTKAMERLFIELGGKIEYNTEVEQVISKEGHTQGVLANGKEYLGEIVVMNADFPYAMKNLIKDSKDKGKYTDEKIEKMQYSSSSFMLYLGLNKKYDKLNVHNIRFAMDFDKNIEDIFSSKIPDDPSIYMYSPSQIDPTIAPEGKEMLYVLVPVPNLHKGNINWDEQTTKEYRNKIIDLITKIEGFEDIKENIIVEKVLTPEDFKVKFNLHHGATFGLKPTLLQSNYFRPQNKFKYLEGLYSAGSSVHPGAGVPIVMTSAKLVVNEILKDQKMN